MIKYGRDCLMLAMSSCADEYDPLAPAERVRHGFPLQQKRTGRA